MQAEMKKEVKERPILFSSAMVNAILEGRKTQTRRVVKPMAGSQSEWLTDELIARVPHGEIIGGGWQMHHPKAGQTTVAGDSTVDIAYDSPLGWIQCPYGVKGDRLWVRETWADVTACFGDKDPDESPWNVAFKADNSVWNVLGKAVYLEQLGQSGIYVEKWKPSIHMHRQSSRITLEITNVRVERLQDISEEDAKAEGVPQSITQYGLTIDYENYREPFIELWDKINGKKHPWASNPWVWIVEFKRV